MSKKKWLLAIIVCIFLGYLIVSKISPEAGWSVDKIIGGAIGNAKAGIESTAIWQQYDIWFGVAFGAIISALLVYKGRDMYDGVRGIARVRATGQKTVTWQTAPPAAEPVPVQYQAPTPTQTVSAPTQTQTAPAQKEEST